MVIAAGDESFTNYKAQNILRWGEILTRRLRAVFYLHPFTYILYRSGIQTGKTAPEDGPETTRLRFSHFFASLPHQHFSNYTNTAVSTQALDGSEVSINSPFNITITGLVLNFRDRFYKALKLL